jgi:phosphoribosylglycinamide formyltransferase-1
MRILGKDIIEAYHNKIINIHPALLPAFKGLHAQEQAFEYGVKVAGCTVHFVDEGMDTGPIIIQKCVPVLDDDTAESLSARILEQEHKIYPEAVKLFIEGKLKVEGRIVIRT